MLEHFKRSPFSNRLGLKTARKLAEIFKKRRTIRHFSDQLIDEQIIRDAVDVARLAPSGANRQPWSYLVVKNQEIKDGIRSFAEEEERRFYLENPNQQWVQDLKHLHTHEEKAFLSEAPYLILIFYRHYDFEDGEKKTNYYAKESVGISTGFLLSALHLSGINTLTYTPSRMQFLTKLFERPKHEKPFMVIAAGIAHDDAKVPQITKKELEDILEII